MSAQCSARRLPIGMFLAPALDVLVHVPTITIAASTIAPMAIAMPPTT